MNAATNVKRHKLTQEDCDIARFFTRRGMKLKEIGKIIGVDPSTVGKIQKADFRLATYLEQRKEMNRKTAENKAREEAGRRRLNALLDPIVDEERDKLILDQLTEEREAEKNGMTVEMYRFCKKMREKQDEPAEVPGQMKMDLEPEKKDYSPAAQDDTKSMMKFQAAMMDKLLKKLDELIDVLKGGAWNE